MAGAADLRLSRSAAARRPAPPGRRISQKVLTETLRDMERDGLVERRVLKETHRKHVEYALTALGKTLQEPLAASARGLNAAF